MARPGPKLTQINWAEFEKLCALHCTLIEIAEWFNCSEDTIERHVKKHYGERFADIYKKKASKGKISLRRKMYEMAMSGDRVMCIWLSKQLLGYADKVESQSNLTAEISTQKTLIILPDNGRQCAKDLK